MYGGYHWIASGSQGVVTPTGTIVLSALAVILGMQFLLGFIGADVASVPARPIHKKNRNTVDAG
uniref:CAZy families GT2 protein n=1 Tax=uncultured Pseudomonas sp. TaxID=114707 RepID=A0A060BVX7_9PSED|nr:CAZy families GT2 protein [uncultured Pseudomonas sp.]